MANLLGDHGLDITDVASVINSDSTDLSDDERALLGLAVLRLQSQPDLRWIIVIINVLCHHW